MTRKEYQLYLLSDEWQQLRAAKYASKNKRRCAICGSKESLHVHHLRYGTLDDVTLQDLRILCARCHTLTHKLLDLGAIKYRSASHQSRFALTKNAVLKELSKQTGRKELQSQIAEQFHQDNQQEHPSNQNYELHRRERRQALLQENQRLKERQQQLRQKRREEKHQKYMRGRQKEAIAKYYAKKKHNPQ